MCAKEVISTPGDGSPVFPIVGYFPPCCKDCTIVRPQWPPRLWGVGDGNTGMLMTGHTCD